MCVSREGGCTHHFFKDQMMKRQRLDVSELYNALNDARIDQNLKWEDISEDTGLAAPLFSRLKHGRDISANTYLTLMKWLGKPTTFARDY